jgi:phage terminase small subunit
MNEVTKQNTELAPIEDDYGPGMSALPTKERAFVIALFDPTGCSRAEAAKRAGFGNANGSSTAETLAKIGYRLANRPRVQQAIAEMVPAMAVALGPQAIRAISDTLLNSSHPQRLKAGLAIVERISPTVQRIDAHHTHEVVDRTKVAVEHLTRLKAKGANREFLIAEFGEIGLAHYETILARQEQPKTIDAEFKELPPPDEIPRVEDL